MLIDPSYFQNGFVECSKYFECPPIEGCHLLVERNRDGCCRRCEGKFFRLIRVIEEMSAAFFQFFEILIVN